MEELTKQQIVLVTLLVSFVTSIATGIVTVALMDQAPPGVTQTINRVVERTVEKITPVPTGSQAAAVATKETIIVKEDDLIVKAVERNQRSLVSIVTTVGSGSAAYDTFFGNALILDQSGSMVTDSSVAASVLDEAQNPVSKKYTAIFPDGVSVPLTLVSYDSKTGFAFFKPATDDKTKLPVFIPGVIADSSSVKLGQTVIALGGEKVSVATGIVSNLSDAEKTASQNATTTAGVSKVIRTDISAPGKALGAVILNLSGEVIGIRSLAAGAGDTYFTSIPKGVSGAQVSH